MLTSMEPDIFLAVESKLDDSVYDNEFLPATYSASRKDRKRGGGGVFIATKEPIIAEPLPELDTDCELRWVKIQLGAAKTFITGVFHRPPDSPTKCLQEQSICLVRQRYPEAILLLGGDFNLTGINWNSLSHVQKKPRKEDCEFLLQISANFHMDQLNHEHTRKRNILELVFSTCPELMTSCTTRP